MTFSERLKQLRKEQGLTLKEVADAVKVSEATVSRWENDIIVNIRQDNFIALSKFFNVTPTFLLGWDIEPKKESKEILNIVESVLKEYLSEALTMTLMEEISEKGNK